MSREVDVAIIYLIDKNNHIHSEILIECTIDRYYCYSHGNLM